jgi:hypothetical protein
VHDLNDFRTMGAHGAAPAALKAAVPTASDSFADSLKGRVPTACLHTDKPSKTGRRVNEYLVSYLRGGLLIPQATC